MGSKRASNSPDSSPFEVVTSKLQGKPRVSDHAPTEEENPRNDIACRHPRSGEFANGAGFFTARREGLVRRETPTKRFAMMAVPTRCIVILICLIQALAAADATADEGLWDLSIEQLMDLDITSVAKHSQKFSETPAALTVVTGEDIRRSGATSIPEALRLVPGATMWGANAVNGVYECFQARLVAPPIDPSAEVDYGFQERMSVVGHL